MIPQEGRVVERKLAAIHCADVYGYSRLMGEDEEATLRTLSSHRKLIDSLIERHHGRFVNPAGDSVLAEFASVVNSVQCAVESAIRAQERKRESSLKPPYGVPHWDQPWRCDGRGRSDLR
jgi:adenylate cyclase